MRAPPRILFVHGMESGPRGGKVRSLRKIGEVKCPDMLQWCSLTRWKENSVVRVLAPLTISSVTLGSAAMAKGVIDLQLAIPALLVFLGMSFLVGLRYSVYRCIQIQRCAISTFNPDVIVASSFGGYIALCLISQGLWYGPTVLLAPAQYRLSKLGAPSICFDFGNVKHQKYGPVTIVHGLQDRTVPIKDSQALDSQLNQSNKFMRVHLIETNDTHGLAKSATPEKLSEWVSNGLKLCGDAPKQK